MSKQKINKQNNVTKQPLKEVSQEKKTKINKMFSDYLSMT